MRIDVGNDDIDWYNISAYQPLTYDFIMKYRDKLYWPCILTNTRIKITYKLLEDNLYYFNLYWASIIRSTKKVAKIASKYIDKYMIDKLE